MEVVMKQIYTIEELISPIKHLLKQINKEQQYIINKFQQFQQCVNETHEYVKSKYVKHSNYSAYVYEIHHIAKGKRYFGVRYTPNKYSDILLEDLKLYKSSSTNLYFIKRQESHPEEFEYRVMKEFNNEIDAQNYEALLHQLFDVANNNLFYNKTVESFIDIELYKMERTVYDINGNKILLRVVDFDELIEKYKLTYPMYSLLRGTATNINNKLFLSKKHLYEYIKIYTLYYIDNGSVSSISVTKEEARVNLNIRFNDLKTGLQSNGYYLNKNTCIQEYQYENKIYTLFYYTDNVYEITDTLKNLRKLINKKDSWELISVINGKIQSYNGYYLNKELCIAENEKTSYYKYENDEIIEYKVSKLEAPALIGTNFGKLYSGERNSANGFYLDKDKCLPYIKPEKIIINDTKIPFYTYCRETKKVIEKILIYDEWVTVLGNGSVPKLLRNRYTPIKGFYADKHLCEQHYKQIHLYNTKTKIHVYTNLIDVYKDTGCAGILLKINKNESKMYTG